MSNCCNLNSKDESQEFLLMQLKREIQNRCNDINARLLVQDGKIAEACTYIKNNLSNYLRDLIDTMNYNGEFDDLISDSITSVESEISKINCFFDEITSEEFFDPISNTKYYITRIPHCDSKGNLIELKMGIANDNKQLNTLESTFEFAHRKGATICINGGLADVDNNAMGIIIHKGEILKRTPYTKDYFDYLSIEDDNTLVGYPVSNTTAERMKSSNTKYALMGFYTIIDDGIAIIKNDENSIAAHPRQVIAQLYNKDILILTSEGRSKDGVGMTTADVQRILLEQEGIRFAYMLDGGGSTSTVVRGSKINNDLDGSASRDRAVSTFLYVSKSSYNEVVMDLYAKIGELQKKIKNILDINGGYLNLYSVKGENYPGISFFPDGRKNRSGKTVINDTGFYAQMRENETDTEEIVFRADKNGLYDKVGALGIFRDIPTYIADCNIESQRSGIYLVNNDTLNRPSGTTGFIYLMHLKINASFIKQFSIPATDDIIRYRTWNGTSWSEWTISNVFRGPSESRPSNVPIGTMYFDTSLSKPIWFNGSVWIDSAGNNI